ncbi:metal ABC transporter ATP-binding protein [Vibrio marisflavi]|uniref:Zinc import ATP-binding protein ZnuC n=1 Tax=Vibrio marisflavi CECT 7928 TaxID=634439 RepID=A0ABM9A1T5_9VIBR|nr:ATP-binding cassette domain-containing protein [Vibrio marisflavi]CAH0537611.1 Zinc import ATP-binding protein ZnuC [Vibrio marisflavi CECT 7928]
MESIVDVQGLSFAYKGNLVLKDVSFKLKKGDRCALLGPNGGGKTTLVKLLLGLEKGYQGNINLFDRRPGKSPDLVGYVPQQHHVKPILPIRVNDVILMGATKAQLKDKKALKEWLKEVVEVLEIEHIQDRMFSELSGGQRQRVLVARALMGHPRLLILDEPTSNVDPNMTACFFQVLAKLPEDIAVLVVSHDLSILSHNITRVFGLNQTMRMQESAELTPDMLDHLYGMNCHHLHIHNHAITQCETDHCEEHS